MLSKERYEKMRKKYGGVSSWGIWAPEGATAKSNVGNLSIFQDVDLNMLNPEYVFVGLNVAGHGELEKVPDWGNFHSEYRTHHDYKLRYALKDTPYWGAYFTDLIKLHSDSNGGNVMKYIKENPAVLEGNLKSFEEEIACLGTHPILIAMGNKVYTILEKHLGTKYEIRGMSHYARAVSKEEYRKELLATIPVELIEEDDTAGEIIQFEQSASCRQCAELVYMGKGTWICGARDLIMENGDRVAFYPIVDGRKTENYGACNGEGFRRK